MCGNGRVLGSPEPGSLPRLKAAFPVALPGVRAVLILWVMHAPSASAPVILHAVTPADAEFLYQLAADPTVRAQSLTPEPPTRLEHAAWFLDFLHDKERFGWVVLSNHEKAAVVRLRKVGPLAAMISVAVHPQFRGQGIGTAAVYQATLYATNRDWMVLASVKPENWASRKLFTTCGYVEVGPGIEAGQDVIVYAHH